MSRKKTSRRPGLAGLSGILDRLQQSQPEPDPQPDDKEMNDMTGKTFLIVGLGNPGPEYANTRHNIGFMLIDRLADRLGVAFTRMQHKALVVDARYKGQKIFLAKPQTYMNDSGQAVAPIIKFYKIPVGNLMVAYDDMDIPLGAVRIRPKGGSGGQKGMKSIIQRLGNNQSFPRIRLGLGRPPGRIPPPKYLLQDFTYDEQTQLNEILDTGADAVLTFVTDGLNAAMNRYNGTVGAE